jgi:multicomponent Na+:H+ antiporter subunit E
MRRLLRAVGRLPRVAVFVLWFLRALVVANARVAWEVVTPGISSRPAIVRVPTACRNEWEMLLLANTITMTPGTLALEVDTTTWELYVHALFVTSREGFLADIQRLERVMLRAIR